MATSHSVDEIVEGRLRFEATIAAIRGLSGSDQRYLIDLTREPTATGPLSSRVKVGVHRARRRLLVALGEVGAILAGWRILRLPRRAPSAALLIVAVTIPLVVLLETRPPVPSPSATPRSVPSAYDPPLPAAVGGGGDPRLAPLSAPEHTKLAQRPIVSTRVFSPSPETTIPIRYPGNLPPGKITIRPRRPGDHLLCLNNVPLIGQACTG